MIICVVLSISAGAQSVQAKLAAVPAVADGNSAELYQRHILPVYKGMHIAGNDLISSKVMA
jgi:hypothetical protein